jgi:mycothiol system anti-sigma-R factor
VTEGPVVPEGNDHASTEAWLAGHGVDCDGAIYELYSYLDGELTEERRAQIAEHLDYCAPCAGAAGFEYDLRIVIASRCKDRVPDSLIDRVAELIEAERSGSGSTSASTET